MLASVNKFLDWLELPGLKVKPLKIQRQIFSNPKKELTAEEYRRLIKAAENRQNNRLSLLLQTICSTGIRVSELKFITAESAKREELRLTVRVRHALSFSLPTCAGRSGIIAGSVVLTQESFSAPETAPLDRSNIWKDMKMLCDSAGVEPGKVFPHNLRHLFARTYYALEKDLSRLADLLGHSNVSTTRIYTMESGLMHSRQLSRMGLVFTRT